MSSVGITVTSKEFWKGPDAIEKKLGSDLNRKVTSSTKQVLLEKIEFKEASKPDPFYEELKTKYTPLNSTSLNQQNGSNQRQNSTKNKKHFEGNSKISKEELPAPKFFLFEKDRVHLQWKTTRTVGPGLFNLGNTCFLNSVIQVLTYTPPLVNYLATQEHTKKCATVGFCMLCELQRHVLRTFLHSQHEAIKPLAILQKLKYIAKHLRFGHQEDSHEFLRYVIDGMMKSCLAGCPAKLDAYTKATTMVHQVFGGYYRSQVTCEKCHHTSNTYDPLMEVLLDIKHAHSMLNALHKLISAELLNGDNMYLCPRCKRKVPAKKSLRIHEPPNIMTMCLKRFDSHSLFASKINKEISYPERLNLRPFMSTSQGPAVHYKLYAVLVHSGYSCNSGHYYCFVKAANNLWYQMNDSSVRQVHLKTVLAQQAYLLFYIREHSTQKEKPTTAQQPVRSAWTNGTKAEGQNPQKQHLPKVISEPTKKRNKTAPQQFPKRAETFKPFAQNNPRPTSISQQREKVTFAFNHGIQGKKPNAAEKDDNKDLETDVDKEETKSLQECEQESRTNAQQNKEELQVNEISSSVKEDEKEEQATASKKDHESKQNDKDACNEMNSTPALHATEKWTVTPKSGKSLTGLHPGPVHPGDKERTPSMSSELSNPGSVASKTGDWSVSDRSATVDTGPKIPERQHAGWNVSKTPKNEKATEQLDESKKTTEELNQEESHKKQKKRKHSKEKHKRKKTKVSEDEVKLLSDECRQESDDERKREKMKRLKKLKKARKRNSEEALSGEDEPKKKHKKRKKKHKRKRASDKESGSKHERKSSDGSNRDATENETNVNSSKECLLPLTKEDKTDKKCSDSDKVKSKETKLKSENKDSTLDADIYKHKRKERTGKSLENTKNDSGFQNKSDKKEKRCDKSKEEELDKIRKEPKKVDIGAKNIVAKGKELLDKISESHKKDKGETKRLVQYSDDSSEEQDEDSKSESRMREDTSKDSRGEKNTEKRVNSHMQNNRGESRTNVETSGGNRGEKDADKSVKSSSSHNGEKKDGKCVLDALMGSSRKSSNYDRPVERWDGKENEDRKDTEESSKRRRDIWDEEYDRGKVKRIKSKDGFHNRSYHRENSFQREYDRRQMRHNGRHSSSSGGWHKRNNDLHSRRDRR